MNLYDIKETVYTKAIKNYREITPIVSAPSPQFFISSTCLVHMNVFAKFDEIVVCHIAVCINKIAPLMKLASIRYRIRCNVGLTTLTSPG